MPYLKSLIILYSIISSIYSAVDWSADIPQARWLNNGKETIEHILQRKYNGNVAKNMILFLGDGMGPSTVTAGRIHKGQMKNLNGEEVVTEMESLAHSALSKTYNIDYQTPDSAGTATAFLSGIKTRCGKIGVDGSVVDCLSMTEASKIESIVNWAHRAGKSTGIVTSTRITHATPAAAYAHVPDRDMEAFDGYQFTQTSQEQGCQDIASQLIESNYFLNVIFGGGRQKFLPNTEPEGQRIDNRNLINEWKSKMQSVGVNYKFISNYTDFSELQAEQVDHVFGLFAASHMDYEIDRVKKSPVEQPSLSEMVEKAIDILSRNPDGFFLLVEGGRIDHAHHDTNAMRALGDFVAFDEAVGKAKQKVSFDDTLLVVTADHSHVFTIGGYGSRGTDLYGVINSEQGGLTSDKLVYTPLLYGNGPGYVGERKENLTLEETKKENYLQEAAVPKDYETHGGEDVAIYASGPMSFLFDRTVEQSYIAHVIAYSACIGPYNSTNYPNCATQRGEVVDKSENNSAPNFSNGFTRLFILILSFFILLTH